MSLLFSSTAYTDIVFGAVLYFPPIFKAFLLGTVIWLVIHRLLRSKIYSGQFWHPQLMDLSLFIISFSGAFWLLIHR